jgi:nucleotide-binding universal stress UspA family protein
MNTIVVGIDGSENSLAALRWALAEAGRHKATLRCVQAWSYPISAIAPGPFGGAVAPADLMQGATAESLDAVLASVVVPDGVTVVPVAREGSASAVLTAEAADADLLVVGARGRGGFLGLLLGSAASQVLSHAPCPVVIVPVRD